MMKKLLLLSLLALSSLSFSQTTPPSSLYPFPITRVIDGDTVAFTASFLPPPLKSELSIRIWGVDTPETTSIAKCEAEVTKGKAASQFTKNAINSASSRQIAIMKWDKYGGRVLGDVILDGKSLRVMLIESGFAKPYYGGFKFSWCN